MDTGEGAMPTETTTDNRHPIYERMKKYYPEKEYENESAMMDDIDGKLSELETYREENEAMNEKFIDAIESDPELKELVMDVVNNGTPGRVAAAKIWGPEDLQAIEGDPDYADVQSAHESRMAKKEKDKAFISEVNSNISQSQDDIQSFADDNKMSEEEKLAFVDEMYSLLQDAFKGKVSTKFMAVVYTAMNHQKEVDKATENALVEGQNMAIEEKLSKEQEMQYADGVPEITGGAAEVKAETKKIPTTAEKFLQGTGL